MKASELNLISQKNTHTHSHINMIEQTNLDEILMNAQQNGVDKIILPCAYPHDIDKIMSIVENNKYVYAYIRENGF